MPPFCGNQADEAAEASSRGGCPANAAFGAEPSVMSSRSQCVYVAAVHGCWKLREHRYTQSFWEDVQAFAHAIVCCSDTYT